MVDIRQTVSRDNLTQIAESIDKLGDDLLRAIDKEVTDPIRIRASSPASMIVQVENIFVTNPDHLRRRVIPPINGMIPNFSGGTITVPAASGGNLVPSVGSPVVLTLAIGYNANIGVSVDGSGNIVLFVGTAIASTPNLYAPYVPQGSRSVGYFNVQNIGGVIQTVTNTNVVQYKYAPVAETEGAMFVRYGNTVTSGPYTVASDDYLIPIDTTANVAPLVINLPSVNIALKGRQLVVKDVGGNVSKVNKYANVVPNGANSIEGVSGVNGTIKMDTDRMSLTFVCDGVSGWYII